MLVLQLVFEGDSVDLDDYDTLLTIRDGGELINSTVRALQVCPDCRKLHKNCTKLQDCPEIDEKIDVYRVLVRQPDGLEREEYVEISTRLDFTVINDKVKNAEEPWIRTEVLKR